MNRISASALIILASSCFAFEAKAEGASLYVSPSGGTFYVGSTFNVSIFVNTGGENVNAVKVDMEFDPTKLQVSSPTVGKSFISVWLAQPSYSNAEGSISLQGGVPSPGINASDGLVSTITFRAMASGETSVSLLNSSRVLRDDGQGTDILSSVGQGVFQIALPPPAGPAVFSPTHQDQNKWYKNNNPSFSWEKESGVTGFSYALDQDFHGLPDNVSEGIHTSVSYADLADGLWYFHVKAQKGGGWGGTTNYLVQIDATPPASFPLVFEPVLSFPIITSREPIISFVTTDGLSGLDHFELKDINFNRALEASAAQFFIEVSSPYKLPPIEPGEHKIVVRAFDKANNFQEVAEKINVIPVEKPFYLTSKGINIWMIFLNWWTVVLILIPLLALLSLFVFRWQQRYRSLGQKVKNLNKAKEKAEEMKKELKKKLNKLE